MATVLLVFGAPALIDKATICSNPNGIDLVLAQPLSSAISLTQRTFLLLVNGQDISWPFILEAVGAHPGVAPGRIGQVYSVSLKRLEHGKVLQAMMFNVDEYWTLKLTEMYQLQLVHGGGVAHLFCHLF